MNLGAILPVVPTPFRDGRFDLASFERMLEPMLAQVDGYTLLGSTGEAPSLTVDARIAIAAEAIAATPSDKRVVVGVSHTSVEDSRRLAAHAQENGAAGVLCAAPYYFVNEPENVRSYLEALAEGLEIELIFYDNPYTTKTKIAAEDVVAWASEIERLNAVKLTDHDLSKIAVWQEAGLKVFGGDDAIAFRYMAAGVDGMMVIAPALFPEEFRRAWNLAAAGQFEESFECFAAEILPVLHVFGIGDEIATTKELLELREVFGSAQVLPPLQGVSAHRRRLLQAADELARRSAGRRGPQAVARP